MSGAPATCKEPVNKCFNPIFPAGKYSLLLGFVAGCLLLAGCNTTRYLDREKGEIFLSKNEIIFEKEPARKVKNKSSLTDELAKLYQQEPNRRFFRVPRQYFYYASLDTISKSKLGKAAARVKGRTLGELPVFLDTAATRNTAASMQVALQNKGYFYAHVKEEIKTNRKETKARVAYRVTTGGRFFIESVSFISRDSAIQRIICDIGDESFLKQGDPIDLKLYQQEVARITKYLRDHGYAYFYPQYISNLVGTDSSNVTMTSKLELEILTPPNLEYHRKYTVGKISIHPNYDPSKEVLVKTDTLIDGVSFASGGQPFKVKPRTILSSVFFNSGNVFSQKEVDNSVRQLGALGVYRPPTIRFEEDSLQAGVLNFQILLTPNDKWEIGYDFEISNTERKSVGAANLWGLSFSPSLRNRNFLGGAELLVTNMDMGIELALFNSASSIINTLDFRLKGDLYLPRFTDYFHFWRRLHKWHIAGDDFYGDFRQKATSRFTSSYNLLILLNNYELQFVNLSYGYDYPSSLTNRLFINHFGIDLVIPKITSGSRFDTILQQQPFLENSFSKQVITGFLFRDLTYVYSSPPTSSGGSWYFRGNFDVSGLEIMAANSLYNTVSGKSPDFKFFNLEFSNYVKLEADLRRTWAMGRNRGLVARLNAGIAIPYYLSETVPYVKQFYVGGPYSLRGWYARALGPGLYNDPLSNDRSQRNLFYQSGDVKIEANLEYRFLLLRPLGMFNLYGAWFLDAGNIWTLKKDAARVGTHFAVSRQVEDGKIVQDNFIQEMAVSGGFGTRWDFTYFIFRLDLGIPLKNNYPEAERNNNYWVDYKKWQLRDIVFNIGLGYPF
jgi:outer membrane protein assembly factor BamA